MDGQENPYVSPIESDVEIHQDATTRDLRSFTPIFTIGGLVGGFLTGSVGYLLLTFLFDVLLTPPFIPPPNYGQFFFVVFGVTFYMSILGLLLGLIPFISWKIFMPINIICVLSIISLHYQFFFDVNWLEAPIAAMLFLFMSPSIVAIIADRWVRPKPIAG